ncbi:unnamed protein product [Phyllotreta striolata]|uniref:Equilibrative nucleoside transporter 4 n=1 Tax=Phyllotreta striolata TaxID=444603 RepID=A0A9P0GRQ9_PHYSR|nr:unnamed protein product [Phyllotreta striolata]
MPAAEDAPDFFEYAKLQEMRDRARSRAGAFDGLSLPKDHYNLVYVAFILGGIGCLIPYNSFIMASDYFKTKFPESPVVFDMSLVYIITALITVLGNNLLVDVFSVNVRIKFGYFISFLTLCFVVTLEVYAELALKVTSSYTTNLVAVAIIAIGCTIQQSSFYGYTSMLPPKYIHAVMVGESLAGVLTSFSRIATRFFIKDLRISTTVFFMISQFVLVLCCLLYPRIRMSDFIQFYVGRCKKSKTKITLEPREEASLVEIFDSRYGVLKIQTSPPATSNALSFANPMYEPNGPSARQTYKVEDVLYVGRRTAGGSSRLNFPALKENLRTRWNITRRIYPYMVSIFLVYFTTLCLYPGISSEIHSCYMGHWMPMLMMIDFNSADTIGKIVTFSFNWTGSRLLKLSLIRMLLIPAMLLSILPPWHVGFPRSDMLSFAYSIVLGLSNGLMGSIPMIRAPSMLTWDQRELAGNMMTLFYMWGLATGSLGAYCIEKSIRPFKAEEYCNNYKYTRVDAMKPYRNFTTDATTLSTTPSTIITTILSSLVMTNYTEST